MFYLRIICTLCTLMYFIIPLYAVCVLYGTYDNLPGSQAIELTLYRTALQGAKTFVYSLLVKYQPQQFG